MTEDQEKRIFAELLPKVKLLLEEAESKQSLVMLQQIQELIVWESFSKSIPDEWMKCFGSEGLASSKTVAAACYLKKAPLGGYSDPSVKAAFINRDIGRHAEEEMLESLRKKKPPESSHLLIAISRAPCKDCLCKLLCFLKEDQVSCSIGFSHWYRGSSLKQMHESLKGEIHSLEYHVLTLSNMERDGIFSPLFSQQNIKRLVGPFHAYKNKDTMKAEVYSQAWNCAKEEAIVRSNLTISDRFKGTPETRKELQRVDELNGPHLLEKRAQDMMVNVFPAWTPPSSHQPQLSSLEQTMKDMKINV